MPQHHKGRSGDKKIGHNKVKCQKYRMEGRLVKNKARRIAKQVRLEAKKKAKLARRKALKSIAV